MLNGTTPDILSKRSSTFCCQIYWHWGLRYRYFISFLQYLWHACTWLLVGWRGTARILFQVLPTQFRTELRNIHHHECRWHLLSHILSTASGLEADTGWTLWREQRCKYGYQYPSSTVSNELFIHCERKETSNAAIFNLFFSFSS